MTMRMNRLAMLVTLACLLLAVLASQAPADLDVDSGACALASAGDHPERDAHQDEELADELDPDEIAPDRASRSTRDLIHARIDASRATPRIFPPDLKSSGERGPPAAPVLIL